MLEITATDGTSAPVGLRSLLVQAGSIGNWAPTTQALPISGVYRVEPIGISIVAGSVAFEVAVQIPIGTADIRIKAARLGIVESETVAYAVPQPITSGKTAPRVTSTASSGSTLTSRTRSGPGARSSTPTSGSAG